MAAEIVADSGDMISEILARLPVKSLMRFRCVSKPWRALISDPYLVKKHLLYARTAGTSRLLFSVEPTESLDFEALKNLDDHGDGEFATIRLDFPVINPDPFQYRMIIFGSCDGLVCVFVESKGIVIWNPCTREHILLPSPPKDYHPIAFFGFGYDKVCDDYKVVYGVNSSSPEFYDVRDYMEFDYEAEVHIFALKSGSWRTIQNHNHVTFIEQGVFVNGALHWMLVHQPSRVIVSFNLAEEKFDEIVVPLLNADDFVFDGPHILVYRNCLCMYQVGIVDDPWSWTVWTLTEYGVKESWTQVIEFSTQEGDQEDLRPLCILENGAVLMHKYTTETISLVLINQKYIKNCF